MQFFKLPIDERFIWHDAVYVDTQFIKLPDRLGLRK